MEKRASPRDSSSFSFLLFVDFLFIPTMFNWVVYFTKNKFFSGSVSCQTSFSQKICIREKKEDESLTKEGVEALIQNLGISGRNEEDDELSFDSSDVLTVFDEKEPSLDEVKEAFDVFDVNGDGFIDSSELQRIVCVLGRKDVGSSTERCEEMIKCFDLNDDGRIDFYEFVKLMDSNSR